MNRIAILLAWLVAIAIGAVVSEVVRAFLTREPEVLSVEVLLSVASEINKNTPMMVDAETEMIDVAVEEGTIIYNYRLINVAATSTTRSDLTTALLPTVAKGVCTNPKTRGPLLNRGVVMRYVYYDRNRQFITSFDITRARCSE